MFMKSGERWHCTSYACRLEVVVDSTGSVAGNHPRCACGSLMKKVDTSPVFRYLDFLRLDERLLSDPLSGKD